MIIDFLNNMQLYSPVHRNLEKAFGYMAKTDFKQLNEGKHVVDGETIFALVSRYETKDANQLELEGHQKYIDIQFLVEGAELFGHAFLNDQQVSKPYVAQNDIAFFRGEAWFHLLEPGSFVIFFPHDLHMPGVKVNNPIHVKKVVIKVAV